MATDRMFLKCVCGAEFCIAKTMDTVEWYLPPRMSWLEDYDRWLREHSIHRIMTPAGDRRSDEESEQRGFSLSWERGP